MTKCSQNRRGTRLRNRRNGETPTALGLPIVAIEDGPSFSPEITSACKAKPFLAHGRPLVWWFGFAR